MPRPFESADPLRRGPIRRPRPSTVPTRAPRPSQAQSIAQPSGQPVQDQDQYREFPLRAYTAQEMADSRYHIIKFAGKAKVDPATDFTPPIRFQRKDPKTLSPMDEEDEKEHKRNPFYRKRKTHQAQGGTDPRAEAIRKLRQEEHYPWVMEDFDNKNAWVSSYEAAQSDTYCVFVFDRDGFKMIPIEKWYKMSSRNRFPSLSLEQAEERMTNRNGQASQFLKKFKQEDSTAAAQRRMRMVEGSEERTQEKEEMDYDEEFPDDEGAPIMEGPEDDIKDIQDRIKKEQRQAGHPTTAGSDDIDDLFDDGEQIDKQGRKLKKYLRSRENNAYYDSDDDDNPYVSQSDSESETEIKVEPTDDSRPEPALSVFRRKQIKNLPYGMAVIQLPPHLLNRFPKGQWNPGLKPREADKKPRTKTPTPPANNNLLTADDVKAVIASKSVKINDLLQVLGPKIRLHPDNKDRLKAILKEVARLKEDKTLTLI